MFIDARDTATANCPNVKATPRSSKGSLDPERRRRPVKGFPDDVAKQVKTGLVDYSKTDDGKKVFKALFSWDGMQEIAATFYDPIREAVKLSGIDVQGLANATPRPAPTPTPSPTASP